MSVKIRLSRFGRKKAPYYRIVVADERMPRDGRFVESLGHYQPLKTETKIEVNEERALYWLSEGAVPSDTVRSLLRQKGVMKKFHEIRVEKKKQAAGKKSEA